ncbi:MAG TPA: hypothetical protein VHI93_09520 [Candidatus Thermoplasmatota archaeon]|nr:hypothetical protein [Candidatus Thermoplasmatota archaeon]
MAETAQRTSVPRERVPLTLDAGLVEWINGHSVAGGYFGSPSHAADRALGRLRAEMEVVRRLCRESGTSFRAAAFWRIYAQEMEESRPGAAGRPARGVPRLRKGRPKFYASVSEEMLGWISQLITEDGPFISLSQAVEVGLRRMRAADDGEPRPPDPHAMWAAYQKEL